MGSPWAPTGAHGRPWAGRPLESLDQTDQPLQTDHPLVFWIKNFLKNFWKFSENFSQNWCIFFTLLGRKYALKIHQNFRIIKNKISFLAQRSGKFLLILGFFPREARKNFLAGWVGPKYFLVQSFSSSGLWRPGSVYRIFFTYREKSGNCTN